MEDTEGKVSCEESVCVGSCVEVWYVGPGAQGFAEMIFEGGLVCGARWFFLRALF